MLTNARPTAEALPDLSPRPYTRLSTLVPGLAVVVSAAIQVDGAVLTAAYRNSSLVPEEQLSFPWSGATAVATSAVWGIAQVLLLVGFVAFARSGATRTRSGRTGAWMAVAGTATYVLAHATSVPARNASTDEASAIAVMSLFGLGTVLLSVGLLLAGWSTWRGGAWVSWRRTTPLALGVWMVLLLPLQFTPVLPIAVGVLALATLVFGTALLAESIDDG